MAGAAEKSKAAAWSARAEGLAFWSFRQLVNRCDAWGAYRPDHEVGLEFTRPDGSRGKLGAQRTVRGEMTLARLARHYRAPDPSAILGLHSAGPDNLARWGALDIDWHGPQSTAPDVNLAAALH